MKIPLRSIFFASILSLLGSLASGQTITCPPGAIPEGEPCGEQYNDSCVFVFNIGCGDTLCGTAWSDSASGDADWYQLFPYLQVRSKVTWSVVAEFPAQITMLIRSGGSFCDNLIPIAADTALQPGDTMRVSALLQRLVFFHISPLTGTGLPCGSDSNDYVSWLECEPFPSNDQCDSAWAIGNVQDFPFGTLGATTDGPDEPGSCNFGGYTHIESDIWYCYTAACTGLTRVSVCSSDFDTKLAVYAGCTCPVESPPIACNDNACGQQSELVFYATAGSQYLIRIGGFSGEQGSGLLTVDCCPGPNCPPPNDQCDSAQSIGEVTDLPYSTERATTDGPDEPCVCNVGGELGGNTYIKADIWYCYTATCTGLATVSSDNSDFCPKIAVYEGCSCPVGSPPIACNGDDCFNSPFFEVHFPVTAGNQYLIRIGSGQGSQGTGLLTVRCAPGINCPPGTIAENEPCGTDSNGGCNSIPPRFHSIDFGDTICGTLWAENGFKDSDWYQKTLAETSDVNWIVQAEFPFEMTISDSACFADTVVVSSACAPETLVLLLPPGTYNFLVTPSLTDGLPCGSGQNDYTAQLLPCLFKKGDMNGDTIFTGADVVRMIHCVYLPADPPGSPNPYRCRLCFSDVNCDGTHSPADFVVELNFVYLEKPLPCQ